MFHRCLEMHQFCDTGRDQHYYPKRLLDLTGDRPRLILTEMDPPKGPYVTLSHCWGKDPNFLTLNTGNISTLQAGIPQAQLPKSFAQATKVCNWLQVGYLWIDSLCILQSGEGSDEDWKFHATAMASIYANGIVSISSACATSPHQGFFRKRESASTRLTTERWHQFGDGTKAFALVDADMAERQLYTQPLFSRAWTLQERLLAPRVLHFAEEQIWWECVEGPTCCEMLPEGFHWRNKDGLSIPPCFSFSVSQNASTDKEMYHDSLRLRKEWDTVVRDYTSRNLTFPDKDKFHALAGVAERVAALKDDEYLLGFFRKELPESLLWKQASAVRAPNISRAPTWSWASMDGTIEP
ncbi:uncharacterized protein K452DRAFT_260816, partial [Aplosporella prunicola CBS 121167]